MTRNRRSDHGSHASGNDSGRTEDALDTPKCCRSHTTSRRDEPVGGSHPGEGQLARRSVIKGVAAGVVSAGLGIGEARASGASTSSLGKAANPNAAPRLVWKLDRPKPALPNSYFWTWDHSTNWMLDDPGMMNFGCDNRYLKRADTYIEDYRRLTDQAAGLGVKGILIWGFLRDGHGGVESAKRVADYAAAKGVAIKPGVGTNWYGGVYYEGDHPYNIETFARNYPDARSTDEKGNLRDRGICPSDPRFADWLQKGVRWLFREFAIGGANLENGDFMLCHCARCMEGKADWPKNEPEFWRYQYLGYAPALRAIQDQLKDRLVTWATYKGFVPADSDLKKYMGASMACQRPALVDRLPPEAVAQWTLTGMVRSAPLPLTAYLEDGAPAAALSNETWPAAIKPPTARSAGFLHQGSQWYPPPRYEQIVSTIKEGCLRAYRAGLEGVSIHGEVSTMHVPWALNYLAFSHFIHWPEGSMLQFGQRTLSQVFGSEDEGEAFARLLAHWDAASLTDADRKDLRSRASQLQGQVAGGSESLTRWRFWNWLFHVASGTQDRQTVGLL